MSGFGQDTITILASRVAQQAPVAVRAAFGNPRASATLQLAMDADALVLSRPAARGNDVRILRTQITGARRPVPSRIELAVRVPGDRTASSLRAIECDDVNVIERIVAWLPAPVYQSDIIAQWYEQALGNYRREAWLTYSVALVCALTYAAQAVAAGSLDLAAQVLIAQGGNFAPATLGGEPWRLLTAVFLHGDAEHLIGNLVALLVLGPFVERVYGRAGYAAIFFGTGLLASAIDLWVNFLVVSVGASGAIFGLLGALIAYALRRRGHLPMRAIRIIVIAGSLFAGWSFWQGLGSEGVNNSAHLTGLVTGALIGAWIAPPLVERSARRRVIVLASAGFAAIVVAIGLNQALVRSLSSDWPVVALLDDLAGRATAIDTACNEAVARVSDGRDEGIEPFVTACVTPLETIEEELKRLHPSDPILRAELARRLDVLGEQLAKNRQAAASVLTLQALAPAEERRVAAMESCHAALRSVDAGDIEAGITALREDCIPGLRSALELLPRKPAGNPEMLRYVYAARALWEAEHNGFGRMAEALRTDNADEFDGAIAAVRAARDAFEAATGHSGAAGGDGQAMQARKTNSTGATKRPN